MANLTTAGPVQRTGTQGNELNEGNKSNQHLRKGNRNKLVLAAILIAALAGGWFWANRQKAAKADSLAKAKAPAPAVPVVPGTVEKKDLPIYLEGLGTVQAFNAVTVRTRVDGQVVRVAFEEGQDVRAGDLLVQIDPAPFQAQLDQAVAKKAQDEAQLAIGRITLARNAELLQSKVLAQQEYDTQKALVDQLQATVNGDEAAINNTRVQLGYATITAPISGRTGIRLLDQGNIAHANDSNGLVVITQLRPISILFTLPEQNLGLIQAQQAAAGPLAVVALDRDNHTPLGQGQLAVIDNQIDPATGTIRIKATFPNEDLKLWPGQFINARLLVETRRGGTVVPASVIQRGPEGTFAYVITPDLTAQARPVKVSLIEQGQALIDQGLTPGERVVVDGQYKLQNGAKVKLVEGPPAARNPAASGTSETSRSPAP
jgi:membrane fusion protein, multidrug efflux system